jgi:polyvinyl alcohol dehydrogenase (cytochrome)
MCVRRSWFLIVVVVLFACTTGEPNEMMSAPINPVAASNAQTLPCDVAAIVEQHCVRCHGTVLRGGATIPLVLAQDFAKPQGARSVAQAMVERITPGAGQPMPPPPALALSQPEIATLTAWSQNGAHADPAGCVVHTPEPPMSTAGTSAPTGGAGGVAGGGAGGLGGVGGEPQVDSGVLEPMDDDLGDWPMFGGDLTSSRANMHETAISAANVATLFPAWQHDGAATSATPAVSRGVVYLPAWDGSVSALRVADGSQVWKAMLGAAIDSSPAVSGERVYLSDAKGLVHALDRATGGVIWSVPADTHAEAHLWASPIVIESESLVVVGTASYEEVVFKEAMTFRGSVVGLDAATGAERFRVRTSEGSDGPGVAVWGTVTVDEGRGVLYVGTGNNYAAPGSALSDSMLAIDYATGTLVWSHQFLADDIFAISGATGPDYDIGSTANMWTTPGGKDLLGIGIKSGVYVALDRDTGDVEWMATVSPGGIFGGIISAPAYANGAIYVAGNDASGGQTLVKALDAATGAVVWDDALPQQSFGGIAYANGVVFAGTMASELTAFDAMSGARLWTEMLPDVAGSPVVSNGMLFVSWGYPITLSGGDGAAGGMSVYRLP